MDFGSFKSTYLVDNLTIRIREVSYSNRANWRILPFRKGITYLWAAGYQCSFCDWHL